MLKAKLTIIALVISLFAATAPRARASQTNPSRSATQRPSAANQTPSAQDSDAAADEVEPPVKKKAFTPAASLNEAVYLSSREDHEAGAYLDQAKGMLAQGGAGVKTADPQGRTPLHWAVVGAMYADKKDMAAYADLAELLIAAKADVNAEDAYGNTPLDYQDMSPHLEVLELLLEAGARYGDGQNEEAELGKLLRRVSEAASSGDAARIRAALAADLPLGTTLPIKLTTEVSSNKNRAGDAVEAVVAAPVTVANRLVIAPGTKLEGTVLYAGKSANRFERSHLVLDFANLVYPDGTRARLVLRVADVDNARETVEIGRIVGVSFPNNALSQNKVSWGMKLIGAVLPPVGYAMEASTMLYGKKFNREIRFEPGTDLTLEVRIPANVKVPVGAKGFPTFTPRADLVKLVNAQPQRVDTKQGDPVDVTNVTLIGPREKVEAAFEKAGWEEPKKLGVKSGLETFAAIIFKQGYEQAPFSSLYLGGREPDLTYQKQLNTFAKRHHIRIWKVGSYEGQDVWLGAATHDIGMGIDRQGVKPHWYHTVDTRVDGEREKVRDALMFTGGVQAHSLVERPAMPKRNLTPAQNVRETDGRMLVLITP